MGKQNLLASRVSSRRDFLLPFLYNSLRRADFFLLNRLTPANCYAIFYILFAFPTEGGPSDILSSR